MLDTKITGGTVIDGTGATRRRADVGILDGRVVAVGEIDDAAHNTIDADGLVVAPGFVDSHTHHDAQLLWDPTASPSPQHGVTTVVSGNCGFTIAPLSPTDTEYVVELLARVEGMPLDALHAGPAWDWTSFGDYLSRFEGRIGVNAGFLVGHSTLRRLVMGADVHEPATQGALDAMCKVLCRAIDDGGLGFSSSLAVTHNDGEGKPVPSRAAHRDELLALAGVLAGTRGTFVGLNPGVTPFSVDDMALITDVALAAQAPLTWNALPVESNRPDVTDSAIELAEYAASRGATVVAQVIPDPRLFYLSFTNGFIIDAIPGWTELFGLSHAERLIRLRSPEVRARMATGLTEVPSILTRFTTMENWTIASTESPANAGLAGRIVGDVARERGTTPLEVVLDLVVADELLTTFTPKPQGDDDASWQLRAKLWRDPRMVIGASDSGAHLDNASSFTYTTSLLGNSVRGRQLLSLEEAVHAITDVPARLCRILNRGRLEAGYHADVVLFDPDTIAPGPVHLRPDLPGGARRLFAEGLGIHQVLVNGAPLVVDGAWTGATPGTVLRSGRHTG